MKKSGNFLLFLCIGLAISLSISDHSMAQGYFLKKNESGGFFSRLFGGNKTESEKDKEKEKDSKIVRTQKKTKDTKRNNKPLTFDVDPIEIPPYPKEPPPKAEYDLQELQKQAVGECSPQDMALYQAFEREKEIAEQAVDEMSKNPKVPDFPDSVENRKIKEQFEVDDISELQGKNFKEPLNQFIPQNTFVEMMSDEKMLEDSIVASLKCQNWKDLGAKKEARRERQKKRKLAVDKYVAEEQERLEKESRRR